MKLHVWKQEGGSAALEFAFLVPVLSLILTGLIQVGMLAQTAVILHNAAREGARYGALESTNPTPATATLNYLTSALSGRTDVSPTSANVSYTAGTFGDSTKPAIVTVTLPVSIWVPYMTPLLGSSLTLTGTGEMKVTQ